MANNTTHFIGCTAKAAQPTQSHRPALWENMLGTVYALNADGECRYFDYDWDAARAWAGVDRADADLRVARVSRRTARAYVRKGPDHANPRVGQLVLWVRRANTPKLG